ncbi:MAG: hypothetical protein ACI9QN_002445 [Arcticibacterium sp.]|jgi:hypothetical protein
MSLLVGKHNYKKNRLFPFDSFSEGGSDQILLIKHQLPPFKISSKTNNCPSKGISPHVRSPL